MLSFYLYNTKVTAYSYSENSYGILSLHLEPGLIECPGEQLRLKRALEEAALAIAERSGVDYGRGVSHNHYCGQLTGSTVLLYEPINLAVDLLPDLLSIEIKHNFNT